MAKKTRTELSTLALNTNLPDNTTEQITPTTERSQLTDERESVVNYKDDLGGATNAGKFLTVATDGESLTMVDEPSGVPDWITFVPRSMRLFTSAVSYPATIEWTYLDADDVLTIGGTIGFFISGKVLEIKNKFQGETMKMSGGDISFMLEGEQLFRIRLLELTHYGDDFNMIAQDVFGASPLYNLNFKGRVDSSSNRYTFSSISGGKENVTEDDKAGFLSFKTAIADGTLTERLRIESGGAATFSQVMEYTVNPSIFIKQTGTSRDGGGGSIIFGTSTIATDTNYNASIQAVRTASGAGSSELRFLTTHQPTNIAAQTRLTIASNGLATFSNGIKFGGTPSPDYDSGATTLDAYEEGSWNPVFDNASAPQPTYTQQDGHYTRIGNKVYFILRLITSAITQSADIVNITLPFTAATNFSPVTCFAEKGFNPSGGAGNIVPLAVQNQSYMSFYVITSSTGNNYTNLAYNDLSDDMIVRVSGFYEV